jgi:hypothetical protein
LPLLLDPVSRFGADGAASGPARREDRESPAPEYHENPLDPQGSLVFYNHGWDILERCRRAGFADAYLLGYWSLLYGYLGHGLQLVFVAERAPTRRASPPMAGASPTGD